MQTYDSYKDSGIDWLGEIPSHWEVKPGMSVLKERKERNIGLISNNVLSLSYGKIIEKPSEKLTGLVPESFETYQLVYEGDIIFRPTDLQNDKVSLRTGISLYRGIITSAYINLQTINNNIPKFIHYYLHTTDNNKIIYGLGSGLRQNIAFTDFRRFPFPLPPLPEQETIARFLDDKCEKIDELVAIKEQQIDKLKELRQVKIHQAVTKGINPHVEMKDSGIEWIGQIPEHWEVKRLKFQSKLNNNKCNARDSNLPYYGMENIESMTGKHIETESEVEGIANVFYKGNVLFGKLRPYLAKVHLAKEEGLCSSEFLVFEGQKYNCEYLFRLLLSPEFIKIVNASTYGAKMPRANSDFIINQFVPIPPISEQEAIVAYLDEATNKIDQAIAQREAQIEKLKEYKQSLINEVVTGKIKVA